MAYANLVRVLLLLFKYSINLSFNLINKQTQMIFIFVIYVIIILHRNDFANPLYYN